MITKGIKAIIENNPVALATINEDNTPNVIATAMVKVVSDNQVLFTDNYMKQTKENIERNGNVCFVVWNSKEEGFKLIGKAEYFTEGQWYNIIREIPENQEFSRKGAILVTVSQIIKLN